MATILVVDDEVNIIRSFTSLLSPEHRVYGAAGEQEALACLGENRIDLVFLDQNLGGDTGLDVLRRIRALQPDLYVVMISGHGDSELIINAMALGSFDYLEKPLDIDKIKFLVDRAMRSRKLRNVVNFMVDEQSSHYSLNRIVGKSEPMQEVFKQIGLLLNQDVTVLITGENGTGKELIARALHYGSHRKEEPFVAVNCSGLTETLLDNELFGHERQAFTGADSRKVGRFETAGEGTIFLDEVGEMPPSFQVKLLRVLQEREFHRLGGSRSIPLRARVITATNVDIERAVADGRFRKDLFYRINVARITVPALRDRREDIPLLLNHFVKEANRKLDRRIEGATEDTIRKLMEYGWPGNIRELENMITIMCINTHGNIIRSSAIPAYPAGESAVQNDGDDLTRFIARYIEENADGGPLLAGVVDRVEREMIEALRATFGDNKTKIASAMGISRVTLAKKIRELGL